MAEKIDQFCECASMRCYLTVKMTHGEASRARDGVIIVDGCPCGPEPGEKLLGEGRGYRVYSDSLSPAEEAE